jgi:predicted TIM-barrel fold metal-dependent hydrolase
VADDLSARIGDIVDANVHLWDQASNPVFWLSDRTLVQDMLGNYDTLPDRYTLDDYRRDTAPLTVAGVVWSDPGTADPERAIDAVEEQVGDALVGLVTLADPLAPGFPAFVERVGDDRLVTSVRVRLVPGLGPAETGGTDPDAAFLAALRRLAGAGLVATIEASADHLPSVTALVREVDGLRVVIDHFGWPSDLTDDGRARHLEHLTALAAAGDVATRIDAIGTVFGAWERETIRPWLEDAVEVFGADRTMLGSDMPIETLRSSVVELYGAYDAIFARCSSSERYDLFAGTARRWYGARSAG